MNTEDTTTTGYCYCEDDSTTTYTITHSGYICAYSYENYDLFDEKKAVRNGWHNPACIPLKKHNKATNNNYVIRTNCRIK